jgi:multiple sugar transport system ATP-binding protein
VATRAEIAALQQRLGITTVYVTHDQVEAMTMGDRVAVMKDGLLQQCATPRQLYEDPVNAFVAGFIGSPPMNLVAARRTADGIEVGGSVLPAPDGLELPAGSEVTVGLRPEALRLTGEGEGIPAVVTLVEELGAEAFLHASLLTEGSGLTDAPQMVVARVEPHLTPAKGAPIKLHAAPSAMLFFDSTSGTRIRLPTTAAAEPR